MYQHARCVSFLTAAVAAFAIVLAFSFAIAGQAHATQVGEGSSDSSALAASTLELAPQATKTVTDKKIWLIAGKKIYQWSNYYTNKKNGAWLYTGNNVFAADSDSNMKSSKPKVIAAKKTKYGYYVYKIKKAGKTTITYNGTKYTNGRSVSVKCVDKHTVYKYANPLKALKVGSTNYAGKLKKAPIYNTGGSLEGTVKVKAAKGWKAVKMRSYQNENHNNSVGEQRGGERVHQGDEVSLEDGAGMLEVICYNKAKKYYTSVVITAGVRAQDVNAALW